MKIFIYTAVLQNGSEDDIEIMESTLFENRVEAIEYMIDHVENYGFDEDLKIKKKYKNGFLKSIKVVDKVDFEDLHSDHRNVFTIQEINL